MSPTSPVYSARTSDVVMNDSRSVIPEIVVSDYSKDDVKFDVDKRLVVDSNDDRADGFGDERSYAARRPADATSASTPHRDTFEVFTPTTLTTSPALPSQTDYLTPGSARGFRDETAETSPLCASGEKSAHSVPSLQSDAMLSKWLKPECVVHGRGHGAWRMFHVSAEWSDEEAIFPTSPLFSKLTGHRGAARTLVNWTLRLHAYSALHGSAKARGWKPEQVERIGVELQKEKDSALKEFNTINLELSAKLGVKTMSSEEPEVCAFATACLPESSTKGLSPYKFFARELSADALHTAAKDLEALKTDAIEKLREAVDDPSGREGSSDSSWWKKLPTFR